MCLLGVQIILLVLNVLYLRALDLLVLWWTLCHLALSTSSPMPLMRINLSDCCRLVTLMMYMPPVSGVKCDMDVDIEIEF